MANYLLELNDPWDRVVVLSSDQWLRHITSEHPEMEALFQSLSSTVTDPHLVTFDLLHRARENFYRFNVRGRLLLKVCVHFTAGRDSPSATGIIVTACLTGRVKPKERVKWSSSI